MPPFGAGHGQGYGLFIAIGVALVILLLRNRRPRKLRIELLWMRPLIFLALLVTTAVAAPPPLTGLSIALMALALGLGAALGWQRGRFIRIEVDPDTHAVTARASPIGMVFILALMAARFALRGALVENSATFQLSAIAVTDALLVFAVGMMVVQNLEMWLRARRLLGEAQAAKAGQEACNVTPPIVQ
ncbi:MAG: DUF1453 family protein [Pseudomonadota bacterium]|nr:DUF1453 family protein [Pseudomonadota bacterium]